MIKLSICIISIAERHKQLCALTNALTQQKGFNQCELVITIDDGVMRLGAKRQAQLDRAMGEYIVAIDDDDQVADDYIERILEAIDKGKPDAVLLRGLCKIAGTDRTITFDYDLGGEEGVWDHHGVLWRSPGHLCPIKASIARLAYFPQSKQRGEDLAWSADLRPFLKTAARASSKLHPDGVMYFYRLDEKKAPKKPLRADDSHQRIFTPQYVSKSGPGSTVGYSQPYREWLGKFIREHKIKHIVDLGCGDMTVMGNVELGEADYIGFDVIEERVRLNRQMYEHDPSMMFAHGDIRSTMLDGDLILCKDVLQHWMTSEVKAWLERLHDERGRFRYALITNCSYGPTVNTDIVTGSWRALDITKPPFSVGERVFSWGDEIGGFKDVVLIKGLAEMSQ